MNTISKLCFNLLSLTFFSGNCFVAKGQWTWVHGDSVISQSGIYGVKGIPSSANKPGGRYEAAEWTDSQGMFWLFGGLGLDINGDIGALNDLWKYNPATNQWTWLKGDSLIDKPTNYGVKGVSLASNDPGSRGWGITSWMDNYGKLWLFGGQGTGWYNDLWRFDPLNTEWTWMSGDSVIDQKGIYGVKGITTSTNMPGARYETSRTWKDVMGNLWLMGGAGFDVNDVSGSLNDLWKYDPDPSSATYNQWTWQSGDSIANQKGAYGTIGIPSINNKPGGRDGYTSWTDKSGNFWLFGSTFTNDLWKFNPITDEWTWLNGDSAKKMNDGFVAVQCAYHAENMPSSRYETRARWVFNYQGNETFYMFGGVTEGIIKLNDLWAYCPYQNQWALEKGDTAASLIPVWEYGIKGVSSPLNLPPPRGGANAWQYQGELWMFGGWGPNGFCNDLWKYTPDTNCIKCLDETIQEKQLLIPNVFTPNRDGINDVFEITAQGYKTYSLKIYSRWGQLVFESKNARDHWDGIIYHAQQEAPESTYYYVLELSDSEDKKSITKGFITLLR